MSRRFRLGIALGLLAFVGNATLRPAIAGAAPGANDTEEPGVPGSAGAPTVTPHGGNAPPPPPYAAPPPYGQYPPPPPGYAPYPPPYAPGYPGYPPLQLTKVHKVRRGLVTGGAITFGVSWGIAASISFVLSSSNCSGSGCSNNADYLWIPVAGPLVVASSDSGSDGSGILLLWSAAQAAGLAMFIIGMMGHDVMEYRVAQRGPTLHLGPLLAREAGGMTLTARW
jgi:hypothetical protein